MLTDTQIKRAKAAEKPYKLADSLGLYLYVTPAGGKSWRFKYRIDGKEKRLTFGLYPAISLADAREARDAARKLLAAGKDPAAAPRVPAIAESAPTFGGIAREWHALNAPTWVPIHAADVLNNLERDVFPALGNVPLTDITAPMVLKVLRAIEARPAIETARRARQRMAAVFGYAIAAGLATANPAAAVQDAMAPLRKGRQPAVTGLDEARKLLRDAEATPGHPLTKLALRLLAITALRPGTLRTTPWSELADLDPSAPLWRISAERMKLRLHLKDDEAREHWVPLPAQALDVLAAARQLAGRGPLVFPNSRHAHKPMSENAVSYLMNRAGYHHRHVPHGWRATFSTVMNERFPADRAVIDLMLSHVPKDKVESAYNRADHLARRRELAQIWADLITDGLPPAMDLLRMPRR